MRHNLPLTLSKSLLANEVYLHHQLIGIADGDCVMLKQAQPQATMYAICRSDLQISDPQRGYFPGNENSFSKELQLSGKLAQLNNFNAGVISLEKVMLPPLQSIVATVSELDWKIIARRKQSFEQQILEQVGVVWPGGKVLVQYSEGNTIVLKFGEQGPGRIGDNCMAKKREKMVDMVRERQTESTSSKQKRRIKSEIQCISRSQQHKFLHNPSDMTMQCTLILIYIGAWASGEYNLVIVCGDFASCPTIEMFKVFAKKAKEKEGMKSDLKSNSYEKQKQTLVLVQLVPCSSIPPTNFSCSQSCRVLCNLFETILLVPTAKDAQQSHLKYQPKISKKSLAVILKDPLSSIVVTQFPEITSTTNNSSYKQQCFFDRPTQQFSDQLLDRLVSQGTHLFLDLPYIVKDKVYTARIQWHNEKDQKQIEHSEKKHQQDSTILQIVEDRHQLLSTDPTFRGQIRHLLNNKVLVKRVDSTKMLAAYYNSIRRWMAYTHTKAKAQEKVTESIILTLFEYVYKKQLKELANFLIDPQCFEQARSDKRSSLAIDVISSSICLLCSQNNNGKSLSHLYLRQQLQMQTWRLDFKHLNSPQYSFSDISSYLQYIVAFTPYSVIFIDNIDALCYRVPSGQQHRAKERLVAKLVARKLMLLLDKYGVKAVVTARSQAAVDEELFVQTTIVLNNPDKTKRQQAVKSLIGLRLDRKPIQSHKQQHQHQMANQYEQQELDLKSYAVSQLDIQQILRVISASQSLSFGFFAKLVQSVFDRYTCCQVSEGYIGQQNDTKKTNGNDFSKLAGLHNEKAVIHSLITKPLKYGFLYKSLPIKLPRAVLLYGGTGNGKSALGSALQYEFPHLKYFCIKGSDILSKYIGGSEAAVRQIFEKAMSVSPSIIFFDEFESIVPRRNSGSTGVNDRIVNQFLCYLDGVATMTGVYLVAASSRPDLIDPAVLRPGRVDLHLFLDYPNAEEREEMLRMFSKSVRIDEDMSELVRATFGFSYSDLMGLVKQLRVKRASELLKKSQQGQTTVINSVDFIQISKQLFTTTISVFKISVNHAEQKLQREKFFRFKDGDKSISKQDLQKQKQILQ